MSGKIHSDNHCSASWGLPSDTEQWSWVTDISICTKTAIIDKVGAACYGSNLFAQTCLSENLGSLRYYHQLLTVSFQTPFLDHNMNKQIALLGPVVQSIVNLTKSLVNDLLSLLKSSVLIFFAEKMWGDPHIFSAKNGSVFMYNMFEILTSR